MLTTVIQCGSRMETELRGGKRVSNILIKVENREAEQLWSYLLTYTRMTCKPHDVRESSENGAFGVMPTLENATTIPKQKRNIKRRCPT